MSPRQALRAFEDLGARTFVAMHWGTFKLWDEPLDEPPRLLEAERQVRGIPGPAVSVPAWARRSWSRSARPLERLLSRVEIPLRHG